MRTVKSEYKAGAKNGTFHNPNDPLHKENFKKANNAVNDPYCPPLVKSYWTGYLSTAKQPTNV